MDNVEKIKNEEFKAGNRFYMDVARQYFIENTYVKEINEEFDNVFDELFPLEEVRKRTFDAEKLNQLLIEIMSDDENIRLKASRYLSNETRKEINVYRKQYLAHPLVVKKVLMVLKDEENKKIIINLLGALNNISSRLKFKDLRIYNSAKIFFKERTSRNVKLSVVSLLSNFDNPAKWDYLYKIAINKPNKNTLSVIRGIIGVYYREDNGFEKNLTKEMRDKLLEPLYEVQKEVYKKYPKQKSSFPTVHDNIDEIIEYLEDGRFRDYSNTQMVYID